MNCVPRFDQDDRSSWPPGTVTLEELRQTTEGAQGYEIVLVPAPSNDPNDPLNWKPREKYLNFGLTLLYSLLVFALISAITPTWAPMNIELGFSYKALNDSYATGSATLAVGALLFIPFALQYGRRPIYILSLLGQLVIAIWSANMETNTDLFLTQAFDCLLGALAEVIVQMTVADVFFVHERGLMSNLYVCTSLVGTSMAALVAGFITVSQGWRWVWWWVAILVGACLALFTFLYEETKFVPHVDGVSQGVTTSSTVETDGASAKKTFEKPSDGHHLEPMDSIVASDTPRPRKTYAQRLKLWSSSQSSLKELAHHGYQPLVVLFTIPAVMYVALLYGMVTAALQVSVTLVATYMPAPPYSFNAAQIGLMSLPPFIGSIVGTAISAPFNDRMILYLARRNRGIYEPEMRLWLLLIFAPLFPAGLLVFGYGLGKGMAWPVVAVGLGLFSAAMTPIGSVALTYLTDGYTEIIADAVVAVTFIRNVFATIFVFALMPWTARVQLHNVILTFAMINVLILGAGTTAFLIYGKRLRSWTQDRYRAYAMRQMDTRN